MLNACQLYVKILIALLICITSLPTMLMRTYCIFPRTVIMIERKIWQAIIGDKFWMANEGIQTPPIVILSACHTAPRGFGCITIADMLFRSGAHTVLGTFIPVNAFTNTILMTRLFTCIVEAQQKIRNIKPFQMLGVGLLHPMQFTN